MDGVNFVFDGNYLVAEIGDTSGVINYQMEMLIHTEIKYLLPVKRQMKNNTLYLYYDLAGKTSLSRLVTHKKMPDSAYVDFVKNTLRAVSELEEYQLSAEGIVLDDNYIFVHPTEYVPHFVYLPIKNSFGGVSSVVSYLKNMLVSDIVDIRNSAFMQQTISVLNSGGSISDMLVKLDGVASGTSSAPQPRETNRQSYTPAPEPIPVPTPTPTPAPAPTPVQRSVPQPQKPVQNNGIAVPGGGIKKPVVNKKTDEKENNAAPV
jgi:hypothetical protein